MPPSAVVRIFATSQLPSYDSPWQTNTPESSSGSGVIIGEGLVLTGAHVVADATFLQVQKVSDPQKFTAQVVGTCHDCDLALLKVRQRDFRKKATVAELGELCRLRDHVQVVGFPVGGEEVSITEGVVSRIETQYYSHSQRSLLAVTVDAAINEGNSGGPVFKDGKVAGIAFQTLNDAENIGEMVPAPLIQRFLQGVTAGRKDLEVPALSVAIQSLENPTLKSAVKLRGAETGVLVRGVQHGGSAEGKLRRGDVLLEIDGHKIEDNGTVRFRDDIRTRFDVVLGNYYVGDRLRVVIKRNGKRHALTLTLRGKQALVRRSRYETAPSYFVFSGMVFQPLTRDFLETWPDWWEKAPPAFVDAYYSGVRTQERQEIIVLSQVLADELTVGYAQYRNDAIETVNGHVPVDMRDLVKRVESSRRQVRLETSSGMLLVLDKERARAAHSRILRRYSIPKDRSHDLRTARLA